MNVIQPGSRPEEFIWASGIEDTFIPQTRPGHRALDEYELIGHYQHWTEELLPYMVEELGITPIVDLMHYGCPFWLRREFASAEYPQAVAEYAGAFVERYKYLTHWYTPLNEPLVNAQMCGKRGLWPPYPRGDSGYIRIMLQLVKGIRN